MIVNAIDRAGEEWENPPGEKFALPYYPEGEPKVAAKAGRA